MNTIRVRFAPSPTGHLHIGSLRTALFNWLLARHTNGVFLLRIEDTDPERSKQEYTTTILESLQWCGIEPDEPVVIQSRNIERHRQVAAKLIEDGHAYRCFCTPEMLAERQHERFGTFLEYKKYDGYCRDTSGDVNAPHVIRFALPTDRAFIEFHDLIRDTLTFDMDQLDDFVLIRTDGMPTYNFAVVVDDADARITHIIRGEDHISNTPKQILLYQACGFPVPLFGHLPMILGPTGQKLSKRDGAASTLEYRDAGYLPDALLNYLARLGWSHGDQEIFTRQELISFFSIEHIGKKGAIFDPAKLEWVNSVHIRAASSQQLVTYMQAVGMDTVFQLWSMPILMQLIDLYKERIKTLRELEAELILFAQGAYTIQEADKNAWLTSQTRDYLRQLAKNLASLPSFTVDLVKAAVQDFCKQQGIKLVTLAQPIRLALIGKTTSPGVFELMTLLGKEETIERINKLMASMNT